MVYEFKNNRFAKENAGEKMTLTYHEKLFSFDLIVFDFKKEIWKQLIVLMTLLKKHILLMRKGLASYILKVLGGK